MMRELLRIRTRAERDVVDITDAVASSLERLGCRDGLCHCFLLHTTAALTTADLDPGTDEDLLDALEAIAPRLPYRHPHDPSHAPDHILASLIGASLTVPVVSGKLELGEWQRIVLVEFSGPRERRLLLTFSPVR